MDYQYRILPINSSERWIFIASDSGLDTDEPDAFFLLIKAIQKDIGGDVVTVGHDQYKISGDKIGLVYQWDGVFGITVIYPSNVTKEQTIAFLSKYIS